MIWYTEQHEWLTFDGNNSVTVGISNFAQQQLGDVVFIDLPTIGLTATKNQAVAVVESVKAASDIYAPLAGKIMEVNEFIRSQPQLVNTAPESEGWLFKIVLDSSFDPNQFMTLSDYLSRTQQA